jgi:hypothetical protein
LTPGPTRPIALAAGEPSVISIVARVVHQYGVSLPVIVRERTSHEIQPAKVVGDPKPISDTITLHHIGVRWESLNKGILIQAMK